ncbi:polynucleotide kinase-phosphatase [Granulicella arctica]|uniref:Protein phosphatase n=1 Tax=Granulicella arctica TaxID=940613 RepID=A0A7Y9PH10_9BACT|nr:polynucleotide kinase-phosphatase [Granulicella arctica]NYF79711.1 protein phosphatase [Granulicella arctica]
MKISIPELSLVLLVGPSGSGKSSFARKHFLPTEVVSSDFCRALVSDNENDQSATGDAFDLLHEIVCKRLARGRLTVVDATNVQPEARKSLIALAKEFHLFAEAIVFDLSERVCQDRNVLRPDRQFGPHVIRNQSQQLRRSLRGLEREGIRHVFKLSSPEEVDAVTIERHPLWNNKKTEHGPFDIIGDVHGCFDELVELMAQLGYTVNQTDGVYSISSSGERKLVFVGDLVDRGPGTVQVLRLISSMVQSGQAFCVPGNHDMKLVRALRGRDVKRTHGLAETMEQLGNESDEFRVEVAKFLDGLVSHYVFDDGKLVVAHAGLKESMHGRGSGAVREFALFGETTGETDEFGLPVRYNWAADYRGKALVVYGHTPVPEPLFLNNTVNIDTGCVFGGQLTALRYPEREIVSVKAHQTYYEPARPFLPETTETQRPLQHAQDDVLDLADVVGKRLIDTRLKPKITIREENAIAALEVMSRFASDPKWLIYLPPTMSPTETSKHENLLEHPDEAFAFYRKEGIATVVCEQKHMGSRAVVVLCKDEAVSQKRFGVVQASLGTVYTRTGRRFFTDEALERQFLIRLQLAVEKSGLWDELGTDWLCLDCELMPWSAKAQELLQKQYAPVGNAGVRALQSEKDLIARAMLRVPGLEILSAQTTERLGAVEHYTQAYLQYCWPVSSLADLKLAPFHLLASEGAVHTDKPHTWHMEMIAKLCSADTEILVATPFKIVNLQNEASVADAVAWWTEMTAQGREGMVVKPIDFIAEGKRGITQPAIKCRGAEYLRIIYGPEYLLPENLERLRSRNVGAKRSLASREFALGIEALERFVRKEPLRLTHECVFGVLALESEPVDPRL